MNVWLTECNRKDSKKLATLIFSVFSTATSKRGIQLVPTNYAYNDSKRLSSQVDETVEAWVWAVLVCNWQYMNPTGYSSITSPFGMNYKNARKMVRRCRRDPRCAQIEAEAINVSP